MSRTSYPTDYTAHSHCILSWGGSSLSSAFGDCLCLGFSSSSASPLSDASSSESIHANSFCPWDQSCFLHTNYTRAVSRVPTKGIGFTKPLRFFSAFASVDLSSSLRLLLRLLLRLRLRLRRLRLKLPKASSGSGEAQRKDAFTWLTGPSTVLHLLRRDIMPLAFPAPTGFAIVERRAAALEHCA